MSGTKQHRYPRIWIHVAALLSALALMCAPASAQDQKSAAQGDVHMVDQQEPVVLTRATDTTGNVVVLDQRLPVSVRNTLQSGDESKPALNSARWQLAPIRFWGDVAFESRHLNVEAQSAFSRYSTIVNLNASTYFYEPWIAVGNFGVGLAASRLNDSELSSADRFATGYATVNIFPTSRFPFEARFSRSDTRIDSDVGADQSYRITRYGVSQRYRPADGEEQYSVRFDQVTQDNETVGRDIQNALQLEASTRIRRFHDLQLFGIWNRNQRIKTNERDDYETLVARHAFRPNAAFSLENSINFSRTDSQLAFGENDTRIFQLHSVGFWRPEKQPLTLSGSFRLFSLENRTGISTTRTQLTNASIGANYAASRNLRLTGGVSITSLNGSDEDSRPVTETVGLSYQGDTLELGNYSYDWFAGATGAYTSGDLQHNGFSFTAPVGHALGRAFQLDSGSTITINLSQNLSATTSPQEDRYKQLTHTGAITWNANDPQSNSSTFIRLSGTDSKFLDGQKEAFQLINLQLTRTLDFDRNSSLAGSLTVQRARSRSERPDFDNATEGGRYTTTASAELAYRHQRAFGVPRLVFSSQLRLNREELIPAIGLVEERELRSWENRLDYSIGRLESRFMIRVAEIDHRRSWLMMLKLLRRF